MAQNGEDKPWRRLYHAEQQEQGQEQQAEEQQQQPQDEQQQQPASAEQPPEGLSELQMQLLAAYRKTCLVAGAGLAGAVYQWTSKTRHSRAAVFLPPRAQALPPEVVRAWQKKAELKEALRTVGRQTLFITGVAGLYFGVELGTGLARGQPGSDWVNTAAAGAAAGGWLGARAPSSMRGRTVALGSMAGSLLGALSGWSQQQLVQMAEKAANGGSSSGSSASG